MQGRWTTAARALIAAAGLWLACGGCAAGQPQAGVRLYTLDCGGAEFADFGVAADTGEEDGRPARLANPCFLVRHPAGWLLWDAGLPQQLPASLTRGVAPADMLRELGFRAWGGPPLEGQLRTLGLAPGDIRYLAFSHLHFDHTGNANLFPRATWILQRAELAWALSDPSPVSMVPELFSGWRDADKRMIDGDADVFGDGSVRILRAPGHTPGSSVLLLRLAGGGSVLLSGDLYLTLEGREHGHVPAINADRAATLASMQRIEAIAKRTGARVIVQHAPADFARLPRIPAFLE